MKYTEYETIINNMVKDPNSIGTAAAALLKAIKEDTDLLDAAGKKVNELTEANNKLNTQIFMTSLGKPPEEPEPEEEGPLSFDQLMEKYGKDDDDGN